MTVRAARIVPVLVALALTVSAFPALAANADHPNQDVNKANDQGGRTGNGKVDDPNRSQPCPAARY